MIGLRRVHELEFDGMVKEYNINEHSLTMAGRNMALRHTNNPVAEDDLLTKVSHLI